APAAEVAVAIGVDDQRGDMALAVEDLDRLHRAGGTMHVEAALHQRMLEHLANEEVMIGKQEHGRAGRTLVRHRRGIRSCPVPAYLSEGSGRTASAGSLASPACTAMRIASAEVRA